MSFIEVQIDSFNITELRLIFYADSAMLKEALINSVQPS